MNDTDTPAHSLTDRQLVALHGLYRGLVEHKNGKPRVYGTDVSRPLESLADLGVINRTGMGAYLIPWGGEGERVIAATADFTISDHL